MIKLKEAVIVEGKYDKIKLSSVIDGVIIETNGFGIFKDKEKQELIKKLARKNGIIILTDSDAAGFQIRAKLTGIVPSEQISHAYIPDVFGKERRKLEPSKEGKLGVEGIDLETLKSALKNAGAHTIESAEETISKTDLFELGLSGRPDSREKRQKLIEELGLPERMPVNSLLRVLNSMYSKSEIIEIVKKIEK